jgi:RHS repeat-associated protein
MLDTIPSRPSAPSEPDGTPAPRLTSSPLHWSNARWYNPTSQRWLEADPSGLGPDSNSYRYCGNDPTNGTDPTGLWGVGGHYYTTFIVARAAKLPLEDAELLAYWSQVPDQVPGLDAVSVGIAHGKLSSAEALDPTGVAGIVGSVARLGEEDEKIYDWMHSLHGGDENEVLNRRQFLEGASKTH